MSLARALLLGIVLSGCGKRPLVSTALPYGGPDDLPSARLHLELAEDAVYEAQRLQARGQLRRAESLLDRAEADAELAVVLSEDRLDKFEAQATRVQVAKLRGGP
jgi:hypothetical protein